MITPIFLALLSPLGTSLIGALLGLGMTGTTASRTLARAGRLLVLASIVWLLLWSTPVASLSLRSWLEGQAGHRLVSEIPRAPAIVVLGGGVAGASPPWRPYPDLGSAADRVWHAARLFHAGKAPVVVLSGGHVRTGAQSEADAMHALMLDLGVPATALRREDASHDTQTNAQYAARLLAGSGINDVILVTSALHMPRARHQFEAAGLRVIAAPTDFEVAARFTDWQDLLPDTRALDGSNRAFKELVALWLMH